MKTVLLLFGGQSSEHAVSCQSTASLIPFVDETALRIVTVGISRDGAWLMTRPAARLSSHRAAPCPVCRS